MVEDGEVAGSEQAETVVEVEGVQKADPVLELVAGCLREVRTRRVDRVGTSYP
jgi:hypothetical protein